MTTPPRSGTTRGRMADEAVERVTILGDGAMATVCSILLTTGGHDVTMWGAFEESIERLMQDREQRRLLPGVKVPADVRLTANDAECFDGATLVLSAIPTQYMRSVWERLKPHLPRDVPIVSVAKGIENELAAAADAGHRRCAGRQAIGRSGPTCDWPLVALSGPNIAGEIARYLPATAVAATPDDGARAARAGGVLHAVVPRLHERRRRSASSWPARSRTSSPSPPASSTGSAAGNNAKAALVTRGLVEITAPRRRDGRARGRRSTAWPGVGDLITTCVSPEGRNRTVGEQIGKGRKLQDILDAMDSVAEGVPTTKRGPRARPADERRHADHRSRPRRAVREQGRPPGAHGADDPRSEAGTWHGFLTRVLRLKSSQTRIENPCHDQSVDFSRKLIPRAILPIFLK